MDSANHGSCSTVVFNNEKKNPSISGPMQFKPVLFKGELYFKTGIQNEIYSTVTFSFFFFFSSPDYLWIFLRGSKNPNFFFPFVVPLMSKSTFIFSSSVHKRKNLTVSFILLKAYLLNTSHLAVALT